MRQVKEKSERREYKNFELTDDMILSLGKFLDSPEGLHIDEVYFTIDGGWFYDKHSYKEDKKIKYYSRLSLEERLVDDGKGNQIWRISKVGKSENEIVSTIPAEELVDKYLKLKNKNK